MSECFINKENLNASTPVSPVTPSSCNPRNRLYPDLNGPISGNPYNDSLYESPVSSSPSRFINARPLQSRLGDTEVSFVKMLKGTFFVVLIENNTIPDLCA